TPPSSIESHTQHPSIYFLRWFPHQYEIPITPIVQPPPWKLVLISLVSSVQPLGEGHLLVVKRAVRIRKMAFDGMDTFLPQSMAMKNRRQRFQDRFPIRHGERGPKSDQRTFGQDEHVMHVPTGPDCSRIPH